MGDGAELRVTFERDAPYDPGVAVGGSEEVAAVRTLADDEVGAPRADLAGDVAPEVARVLDFAVRIAEEDDPLDAERAGGVPLLFLADPGEPLWGHRSIARALVAVGGDQVCGLAALLDHLRDGAARPELRVIGVRCHDHHALDLVGHRGSSRRVRDSRQGYRFRGRRATGYNRTMSIATGGRVGGVVLLVLVAAVAP